MGKHEAQSQLKDWRLCFNCMAIVASEHCSPNADCWFSLKPELIGLVHPTIQFYKLINITKHMAKIGTLKEAIRFCANTRCTSLRLIHEFIPHPYQIAVCTTTADCALLLLGYCNGSDERRYPQYDAAVYGRGTHLTCGDARAGDRDVDG